MWPITNAAAPKKRDEHITNIAYLWDLHKKFTSPVEIVTFKVSRKFEERGVDVVLQLGVRSEQQLLQSADGRFHQIRWPTTGWHESGWADVVEWTDQLHIELKPVIGDDYPAVLRQMKRTGADVLFAGEYTGQGATQEQFVKTMATAGIRVVFARDVAG